MVENTVNFVCDLEIEENGGIPQTFDLDIELKGNFTFSWILAVRVVSIYARIFQK